MRDLTIDCLYLGPAFVASLGPHKDRFAAAVAPLDVPVAASADAGIRSRGTLHVVPDPSYVLELRYACFLGFAAAESDLPDDLESAIHIFVGDAAALTRKHRGLVPLVGQGALGALNTIRALAGEQGRFRLLQYDDLVKFAGRSHEFYARQDSALKQYLRGRSTAACVRSMLPDTLAIFGTGFPYYVSSSADALATATTPPSILRYLASQSVYFARKTISGERLRAAADVPLTPEEIRATYDLEVDRDVFDAYEHTRFGSSPPVLPSSPRTLSEYVGLNRLDVREDPWPCHLCSHLQNATRFTEQQLTKEFGETCLSCRQTTLIPRNVTGCCTDIDLVVVVDADRQAVAELLRSRIEASGQFYLYDTDVCRMFVDDEPPVDIFVVNAPDLHGCFAELRSERWLDASLRSTALWLPLTEHSLRMGANFMVALEPLIGSAAILDDMKETQRVFARVNSYSSIVEGIRASSFYHEQLLTNPTVADILLARYHEWRGRS